MAIRMLRKLLCAGALSLPLFAAGAWAQNFAGEWETNMGAMHLEQDGDQVRGDYDMKDGRLHGEIRDGGLSGIWVQSSSARRCYEERMGSNYWGRFRLHLSDDERYFHGRWSYCDGDPGSGGEWNGKRHHHRHHW